ncbi:MAG: M67 family metallopeptidase [Firmicutes bacterium]|nr:M67 family metallopeptidase [Bacillota bacterium]
MIVCPPHVLEDIISHARETYPHECCGLLAGVFSAQDQGVRGDNPPGRDLLPDGTVKEIAASYRARNLNLERARDRFELDPADFLKVDKAIRARNEPECQWEIVGFYHSHPDHPAVPSEFDRQRAWPLYSYLILSIGEGGMGRWAGRTNTVPTGVDAGTASQGVLCHIKAPFLRSWVLDEASHKFVEESIELPPRA